MQGNDAIWGGGGQRQFGKDLAIPLAKLYIQSFPEIGGVKTDYSVAFVIPHEQIERLGMLDFLAEQEVDVF
jgi:hypothetical protein